MTEGRSPYCTRLRLRKRVDEKAEESSPIVPKALQPFPLDEKRNVAVKKTSKVTKTSVTKQKPSSKNGMVLPCMSTQPVVEDISPCLAGEPFDVVSTTTRYRLTHPQSLNGSEEKGRDATSSQRTPHRREPLRGDAVTVVYGESFRHKDGPSQQFSRTTFSSTPNPLHDPSEKDDPRVISDEEEDSPEFLSGDGIMNQLCSHIRRSLREAYQNPALLRYRSISTYQLEGSQETECPKEDTETFFQLVNYLNETRCTLDNFFLLLLGAPEGERGTMVSAAINESMKKGGNGRPMCNSRVENDSWRLISVVVPHFCRDDTSCLRFLTKSLFRLASLMSLRGLLPHDSFPQFIMTTARDWTVLPKKSRQEKKNEVRSKQEADTTRRNMSSTSFRLKSLSYRQWFHVLEHLIHYLNIHKIFPIFTVEYLECLVLRKTQQRQSLLYSLFNLVASKSYNCGIIGCSSLLNISSFFEKRIQSRYNLSRFYFNTTSRRNTILEALPVLLGFNNITLRSLNPKVTKIIHLFQTCLDDSSTHDIIDFYIALDHRALQLCVLNLAPQFLSCVASFDSSPTPTKSDFHGSKELKLSTVTGTPLKRRKSESHLDITPSSPMSSMRGVAQSPSSAPKIGRSSTWRVIHKEKQNVKTELLLPSFPCDTEDASDLSHKLGLTLLPLDWTIEYHEMILPQLSLNDLLFLSVMTCLHKKRIPNKTLTLVLKEMSRVEKMCLTGSRWAHNFSEDFLWQHKFRLVCHRLLTLRLLETSGGIATSRSSHSPMRIKYPGYFRFLNIYPKLSLPTHIERYLQSA